MGVTPPPISSFCTSPWNCSITSLENSTKNSPKQLRFTIHSRPQLVHFAYSLQTLDNAMRFSTTNIANTKHTCRCNTRHTTHTLLYTMRKEYIFFYHKFPSICHLHNTIMLIVFLRCGPCTKICHTIPSHVLDIRLWDWACYVGLGDAWHSHPFFF